MKMEEWKECTLSYLGTIVGGATPSTKDSSNYENGYIAWITPKDLSTHTERFISHGERNITEKGLKSCSAQLMPPNSILFTSRAPIGYIAIAKNEVCTNQGFKSIVPNKDTDFMFLYYLLRYNKDNIENLGSGTTFKEVSGSTMRNVPVKLPPLPTQQKIAAILSSLDDKIELNNKINTNLEQQAGTLFKNWFVDFEPFGGKMPEGWKVGKLCDIADYSSEKIEINKLSPETYYSTENMLPSKGGIETATSLPSISQTTRCLPGETIISNIRPYFKKIFYCTEEVAGCSTDVLCFKPKYKDYSEYLYQVLYSDIFFDYMVLGSKGTKMPRGDKQQIMNYTITIPDELYLHKYKTFAKPILSQIDTNRKENKRLSEIRDTLLPKLMNGENRQY